MYAAAWFYGMDITIYSKDYLNTGGCLTFTTDSPKGSNATSCLAWHILYHDNNHFNSVRSLDPVPCNSQYKAKTTVASRLINQASNPPCRGLRGAS